MSIASLTLLALALSMDAFAVAVCKGLAMRRVTLKKAVIVGLYFGIFQAGMPLIGFYLGTVFADIVTAYDNWISFILLSVIGGKMIKESFGKGTAHESDSLSFKHMLVLAVATSIDALAVGVTFAFLDVNEYYAISFIGTITFILSMTGVKIGSLFGAKYKSRAELVGGAILIAIGIKILLENFIG